MSSINVKSDNSGEDMRNLAMSWGYALPQPSKQSTERADDRQREVNPVVAAVSNFLGNAISMLAGAATTAAIIAWLTGNLNF